MSPVKRGPAVGVGVGPTFSRNRAGAAPGLPQAGNILGHWRLDEGSGTRFADGGIHPLTDVLAVPSTPGKFVNAARFTEVNGQHLQSVSQFLNMRAASFWYAPQGVTGSNPMVWGTLTLSPSFQAAWYFTCQSGQNSMSFNARNAAAASSFSSGTFNGFGNPGVYFHFVGVLEDAGGGQVAAVIYVNGVKQTVGAAFTPPLNASAPVMTVGGPFPPFASGWARADMDQLILWDVPLTQVDVDALYNGGAGIPG